MSALALRLGSEWRRSWRSWVGLALLTGVLGGVVLASAAGARRTDSAYARLLIRARATDFLIASATSGTADAFYDEVQRLPQVAAAGKVAGSEVIVTPSGGEPELMDAVVSLDGNFGLAVNRPKLIAGRLPDPDRANEALANRQVEDLLGAQVGSEITGLARPTLDADLSSAAPVRLTVVGIAVFPQEVVPSSVLNASPQLLLTPAYGRDRAGDERAYDAVAVRLEPGADRDAFRRQVEEAAVRHGDAVGEVFIGDEADLHAKTERAIRPQSLVLAAFAVLAGAAALLVVGQTFSRQLSREAADYPVLRALGMTRGQVVLLAVSRATLIGGAGAALAVALAVASSPWMPIGAARRAEPDPGLAADLSVLAPGFLAIVVLLGAWASVAAWRTAPLGATRGATSGATRVRRPSRLASVVGRTGVPPTAAVGVRMALEPGWGPSAVPVRSTLVGTAVALAAVAAALTFVANLQRLVTTPMLYGRGWDVTLDTGFGSLVLDEVAQVLRSEPAVESFSGGTYGELTIEGIAVPAVGIDTLEGDVFPTLLEGRAADAPDEIVLGTTSLRELERSVGDTVAVEVDGGATTMRVVGRAVFPQLGRGSFPPTGLGEGAAVRAELLPAFDAPPDVRSYTFYLIRFRGDADEVARGRVAERLSSEVCSGVRDVDCFLDTAQRPSDISNYAEVQRTPLVLAGLLIVLAVATLGHALSTSVRRRRRDLAILRAIGFVRRQVSGAVAWQATTLATTAGLIGVPLGLVVGRWAWLVFARQLGVGPHVILPTVAIVLSVPIAVAVANLVAVVPGRLAARTAPAGVLRSE